jgi:hypothetical protein
MLALCTQWTPCVSPVYPLCNRRVPPGYHNINDGNNSSHQEPHTLRIRCLVMASDSTPAQQYISAPHTYIASYTALSAVTATKCLGMTLLHTRQDPSLPIAVGTEAYWLPILTSLHIWNPDI